MMFEDYPKKRPALPAELEAVYRQHYRSNRHGDTPASGLAQKMERWLHKKVASDVDSVHQKRTLEIGAGTLNQLDYEQSSHYDIVKPFRNLYADSPFLEKIKTIYSDIEEIDSTSAYDRITSVATFEHITDLPEVIARTCLLLAPGGCLRTSIPSEGGFLWKLGWKLTTGLEFRFRYGMDYGILMRHEHVNTAAEIEEILHYFYRINHCSSFGLSKGFSFYRFYESREPNTDLARDYLSKNSNVRDE
ncbi:MAG: hypothetical protein JNL22_07635 [Bacteroidales bacterium]|nr:hypothetical protein [Bacteroidales bacterium]